MRNKTTEKIIKQKGKVAKTSGIKKLTALLLSVIMLLSGFSPIHGLVEEQFDGIAYESQEWESIVAQEQHGVELGVAITHNEAWSDEHTAILIPIDIAFPTPISEARQKYNMLLEGNYWSVELPERFRELFGDLSPDYILHNYTTIFDITSEEMDQAVLRALTRDAEANNHLEDMDWLDWFRQIIPEPVPLEPPQALMAEETTTYEAIMSTGTHTLTVTNITQNTITVHATFPINGDSHNQMYFINVISGTWEPFPGTGFNMTNGLYTLHGLHPGLLCSIVSFAFNHNSQTWSQARVDVTTTLPPESLVHFTRSNMTFDLDQILINAWGGTGSARTNGFLNATNNGYAINHELVGGALPFGGAQMGFRSTRTLPWPIEGMSENPIRWQTASSSSQPGLAAINHAHKMNTLNANTTEMPFHEIGHNFDSWRWSFCTEALAIFFTYHYYERTGERMAVAGQTQVWQGGAGFRTYIRSHANRIGQGWSNYDATIAQGAYGYYGLAWNLADIHRCIGSWVPFRQTFNHFHTLTPMQMQQIPRNIDKLNYFLSRLQDHSGQNVFNMFNTQERNVYQAHFGGQLVYIPAMATITFNPSNAAPWNTVGMTTWNPSAAHSTTSTSVTITPNQNWTATATSDIPLWLSVTSSGSSGSQITITAQQHIGSSSRSGTVTIRAANAPNTVLHTINVTQSPVVTLTVNPTSWNAPSGGNQGSPQIINVSVTPANVAWNWSQPPDTLSWLTVERPAVGNTNTLRLTVQPNTGSERLTDITVSATGAASQQIRVTQAILMPDANVTTPWVYRIRTGSMSNLYMSAVSTSIFGQSGTVDDDTGTDLWYFSSVGGGFYRIESLGIRNAYGHHAYFLTAEAAQGAATGSLRLAHPTGTHSQQWRVQTSGGRHFISNRQFPQLMINFGDGLINLSNSSQHAGLLLEEYQSNRSYFWGGGYEGGTRQVRVAVLPDAIRGQISMGLVYSLAYAWNDIANIGIAEVAARPLGWNPPDDGMFFVEVNGWDFGLGSEDLLGEFRPDGFPPAKPVPDADWHCDWKWGNIFMNLNALETRSLLAAQHTFIHEIGHVLKLDHPHGNLSNYGFRPVSVMNQASPDNPFQNEVPNSSARPSGFDRHNLRLKWGQ